MSNYSPEFITAVNKVFTHVNANGSRFLTEAFPPSLEAALKNEFGDSILSGCAMEIVEGNEPIDDDETPTDEEIAAHGVKLMEQVRDDIDLIITALENYEA